MKQDVLRISYDTHFTLWPVILLSIDNISSVEDNMKINSDEIVIKK